MATSLAFLLPVLALCIYFFNQEIVAKPLEARSEVSTVFQKEKVLNIQIKENKAIVNGTQTSVKDFAKTIDKITKDWTKEDMMAYSIHLRSENGVDKFLGDLAEEFHKTRLYKTNPSKELIPPPPPPAPEPLKVNEITPPAPPNPPSPPSPFEMIKQMTAAGADFYYNGDKITAGKAKELFKTKDNLNFMSTEAKNGNKPMVLITDD